MVVVVAAAVVRGTEVMMGMVVEGNAGEGGTCFRQGPMIMGETLLR